ncbi:MAG: metal ABC transporter permease [Candidatus Rokubacteria bacterium]|nr:metal ABC transporter permease [Candidatus Rokubacteria bacterium]
MLADVVSLMWLPFLACLILASIHVYLGLHVIAREVIFVDIALAQMAALGATVAFLFGHELESATAYWTSLGFTLAGAAVFSMTRTRERRVSQEAVIGVVYVVSAAAAIVLVDRAPHGAEHIKAILVGSLLTVTPALVAKTALLYAAIGLFHYWARRTFLLISTDPEEAHRQGLAVRWWDFLFYASFGAVVTRSVRIAGVLLVFAYLIVPALAGAAWGSGWRTRLVFGWTLAAAVSLAGIVTSASLDIPTGATIVCAFGLALLAVWGLAAARRPAS